MRWLIVLIKVRYALFAVLNSQYFFQVEVKKLVNWFELKNSPKYIGGFFNMH